MTNSINVKELSGPDLYYWVARANNPKDRNILRSHYGKECNQHPSDEVGMRTFIEGKIGPVVPAREFWQ